MCGHCGCGNTAAVSVLNLQTGTHTMLEHGSPESIHHHHHEHPHDHGGHHGHAETHGHRHEHHSHQHAHGDPPHVGHGPVNTHPEHRHLESSVVDLEARILAKNDALAAKNRAWLAEWDILALNLVSSPGSGKTTLLERTIRDLKAELRLFVVEADMVARGLRELNPSRNSIVMIENVGNLVCPALFDLGEWAKVVVLSVTEGEDKPLKYPHMFRAARLMVLNKIDLLPHVEFDIERAANHARQVNPDIVILPISARTGQGLDAWYGWVRHELALSREAVLR
jgi:hydrogenase nickel incorporation protein HypB